MSRKRKEIFVGGPLHDGRHYGAAEMHHTTYVDDPESQGTKPQLHTYERRWFRTGHNERSFMVLRGLSDAKAEELLRGMGVLS